jgi:hypothetical protein
MADLNGSWNLVSSQNFEAYIDAIGVTSENREKALKLLQTTGDGGLVEKYEVDLAANTVKRYIYFDGKLFKESPAVPLNKEVEGTALDDRIIKVSVTTEGTNRLIRHETGSNYTATVTSEVHGSDLTVTLTTGGGVTSVRKYKKV